VFPKIGVPQNGWFIMENPFKIDDLGVPLFSETSINTLFCFKKGLAFKNRGHWGSRYMYIRDDNKQFSETTT